MAESFSRQKSRHAPQKEGGLKILCDLPPVRPRLVRPTNLMSRMDGKKTHVRWSDEFQPDMCLNIRVCIDLCWVVSLIIIIIIIIIIKGTLARSLEPVVTECKHTIHTQTQVVASRKPKEIKSTHEGEANFTT